MVPKNSEFLSPTLGAVIALGGLVGAPLTSSLSAAVNSQHGQVVPALGFGFRRGLKQLKNVGGYGLLGGLGGGVLGAGIGALLDAPVTGAAVGTALGALPGSMYGYREYLNELDQMASEEDLKKIFGKRYPLEVGVGS